MIFRWKLQKFQTNYPQLARVLHLYLTSRNKNKSDKYDSIDNTVVLNGKTERTTAGASFSNAQNVRLTRRDDRVGVIWLDPPERRLGGVSFLLFPSAVWGIAWLDLESKDDDGFLDGWKLYLLYCYRNEKNTKEYWKEKMIYTD